MTDWDKDFQIQHTDGNWYGFSQYRAVIDQTYRKYENSIRLCIIGLTQYAACLSAKGIQEELPALRTFILNMAEFWLTADPGKNGHLPLHCHYGGGFDRAVSEAARTGHAPKLSPQTRKNILYGLKLYAREMTDSGGLDVYVRQCLDLADSLRAEWEQEPEIKNGQGGMTLA